MVIHGAARGGDCRPRRLRWKRPQTRWPSHADGILHVHKLALISIPRSTRLLRWKDASDIRERQAGTRSQPRPENRGGFPRSSLIRQSRAAGGYREQPQNLPVYPSRGALGFRTLSIWGADTRFRDRCSDIFKRDRCDNRCPREQSTDDGVLTERVTSSPHSRHNAVYVGGAAMPPRLLK